MKREEALKMVSIKELSIPGYKKIIKATAPEVGMEAYIAIHSSTLGPALGGVRIYPYKNEEEALEDVLRLAKAMTYKAAVAEVGLGGGKSVMIADSASKTPEMLHAFAEALNTLEGEYIVAEDVGSTITDMNIIHEKSQYVAATALETSSGDPSRFTAWGIFRGMQAVAMHLWNSPSLNNKKILIQGLGSVGHKLARLLFWEGAQLLFSEMDEEKLAKYCRRYGGEPIEADDVTSTPCDIFAPCALGGVINETTVSHLKCRAIAGSANNQLSDLPVGEALNERGILYAPDFIINAGGLINAAQEFAASGYNPRDARDKVDRIYDILAEVFRRAGKEGKSTSHVAGDIAEYNLMHGIGQRTEPITFF